MKLFVFSLTYSTSYFIIQKIRNWLPVKLPIQPKPGRFFSGRIFVPGDLETIGLSVSAGNTLLGKSGLLTDK